MTLSLRRKRTRRQRLQRRAEDLWGLVWFRGVCWFWRQLKDLLTPRRSWLQRRF